MKNRTRHLDKLQKSDPLSKLSHTEIRRYAPTPEAYFEVMEQVTAALGKALGLGDVEYDGEKVDYRRESPDKTKLLELWNNNPLARAFIETMIVVEPRIKGLIEEREEDK